MRDASVCLLAVAQVTLRDQDMPHAEHAKPAKLLGRVEDHRRESGGHLAVKTDLDPSLDLVLTLHKQVKQLVSVKNCLTEVGH